VSRVRAMLAKEFLDLLRNRGVMIPVVLITLLALVLPFGIVIVIPIVTGDPLGSDPALARISTVAGGPATLSTDGAVQFFLFQQFLMLFLITPITGAMALASHSVVGEKQARTLEPLLATPITTVELLLAKVLGALLPAMLVTLAGLAVYFGGIIVAAAPGVARAMATPRTVLLILVVGPAAALVSLQAAIVISSRVNDPRTAQQFGVLIILPLTALLVAQFSGSLWLSAKMLALVGLGLFGVWILLTVLSAVLFERESILTRWR
jgi:ABC-2 type transport system permease protein